MPHPQFTDDTTRWTAVQSRDPEADGAFVYAVKTTKIYCRPVCKARLARRSNVSFYPSPGDAERAGYRACKRCAPTVSGSMPEAKAVKKVRSWVLQESLRSRQNSWAGKRNADGSSRETIKLADMATTADVSKWHFHRICKKISGQTPVGYFKQQFVSEDDPHAALRSSTGDEVDRSSRGNSHSQAGKRHDSQCDVELSLDSPHAPCYNTMQIMDAYQLNQLSSTLSNDRGFPEACNPTMPWSSSGNDQPDFTLASGDDILASLFYNDLLPVEVESNAYYLNSFAEHTPNYLFQL